jgi:hypothetical protein
MFSVCLAHATEKLISGDQSKALRRHIYNPAVYGRLPGINAIRYQITMPKKAYGRQVDQFLTGCACSVADCFLLVRVFYALFTQLHKPERISFLSPSVHLFQIEYYVLNGFH